MEKEINEKTMDFASEMYDFIERSEKKVTDLPAELQAAAKAAIEMKRQLAITEMEEMFDRW